MDQVSIKGADYGNERRVMVGGLTEDEQQKLEGVITAGNYWVKRNEDGRLRFVPAHEPLPDPIKDEEMLPFWRRFDPRKPGLQTTLFDEERLTGFCSPSIIIGSLCGYNYTPEKYKEEAERLESYGFSCMRSERGDDGRYWEHWSLCGLFSARGDLKDVLVRFERRNDKVKLEAAIEFLRHNVSFGTLDVCVQRLAMVMDDDD